MRVVLGLGLILMLMRVRVYCRTWFGLGGTSAYALLVNNSLLSRSAAGRRDFGMQQALYRTLIAKSGVISA
jgi:hypothetical protein